MRQLASVQRVREITPIEGADAIELAHIKGWQCVVKKGEFAAGDLGVYFEIDSIPPDTSEYSFLWKGEERPANYRIKTMRLRGALSQGLLLPLTFEAQEGDDVTERLGVLKWEPPINLSNGQIAGNFPTQYAPKTDEERIQSRPELLEEMQGLMSYATVKLDGTSVTYILTAEDEFIVCGRNWQIAEGDNTYWNVAKRYDIENKMREMATEFPTEKSSFVLQGEIVGPGVQKNRLGLRDLDVFFFNVRVNGQLADYVPSRVAVEGVGLKFVPVECVGLFNFQSLDEILAMAEGKYEGTNNEREGLVFRPVTPRYSPTLGGDLSFKAISNRFLLKGGE